MPVLIGKFSHHGTNYYFDYSTESKEPSAAMNLAEYREYYRKTHGRLAFDKLAERLERADAKGERADGCDATWTICQGQSGRRRSARAQHL